MWEAEEQRWYYAAVTGYTPRDSKYVGFTSLTSDDKQPWSVRFEFDDGQTGECWLEDAFDYVRDVWTSVLCAFVVLSGAETKRTV